MNKPTVLFVGWFFYPKVGGAESIMLNLADNFVSRGIRVGVLTSCLNGQPDQEIYKGITIYRRAFVESEKIVDEKQLSLGFNQILDELKPDIIHFHNGSYPAASTNMVAGAANIEMMFNLARARNIKVIEHAHNAQLKKPEETKGLRDLSWDGVIAVSNFVRERWLKLGTNAKKIEVIHNGVDFAKFSAAKPSGEIVKLTEANCLTILFPARVVSISHSQGIVCPQKNFSLLIKALGIVKNRGVEGFRLVAILNKPKESMDTNPAYDKLDELVKGSGIEDKINFVAEVSLDQMPSVMAAADVVCVPSINETFGLVYLEAMSAGKVAIASNTGGPGEYIQSGKNGFLVDPYDANDLAEVIMKLITDSELRQKISTEAKLTASKFDYNDFANKILHFYAKL